ncbi:MAG: RNA polymerase sigma factor [Prevotella sp.]|nr:RNA polymerase sigma factor [Prevotella sp.]
MIRSTIDKDEQALQLLDAYGKGDMSAFSTLYDMYIQQLLNYGRCITSDMELVKDCVQEVFVRLMDKEHAPKVKRMSSYLIISLRNKLVDEFRKGAYLADVSVHDVAKKKMTVDVETRYLDNEKTVQQTKMVNHLMACLTPRQRQAFQLYYIDEKKYDEICEIMEMNYHSVRNLVHRGMLKLRAAAL